MKKTMKLLTVVAAAAMGLTACQSNFDEAVNGNVKNSIVISFAEEDARTSVDTSGDTPLFSWDEDETFVVLEQADDALAKATSVAYNKVDGKATIDAEFAVNEGKSEYKYITVYPESGYVAAENIEAVTLALPAEQTMAEGSYDPNADLMVSWPVITTAQPTEAQLLRFTRLAAVVQMTIKGLPEGEVIERVEFTANGKTLAGSITADLENPHEFSVKEKEGVSTVSVATNSTSDVYFTVLPTTLEAGETYIVVVETNKHAYMKQGKISADKSLVFEAGQVTRIGANMAADDVLVGARWRLVSDASTLKEGDIVTIVAKNYNYVIGQQKLSYPIASQTEVVKVGNYLYHNPTKVDINNALHSYTLMQRDVDSNTFDFYNGVDYEGDTLMGFAYADGTNNSPKLQAYCNDNTLLDVSIVDGAATITASKVSGLNKYWYYSHSSSNASSRKFCFTNSVPSGNYQICLYRLEGAVGTIPTIAANITVPAANKPVVIAEEGVAEPTAITEEVVFNYVGNWNIAVAVSDKAEWLNVVYDAENNCLKYTAEPNTGAKREAVVTITASLEGQESLTKTFNMLQKGVPQEISIEDFITKAVDVNVTYKLTGILTEIPSSSTSSAAFKISDQSDNTATIKYLYTDGGDLVKGNVDLKLGDVITLTTVVASSKGQGGSSTYPSYYKGHYRLAVSAGVAADYTGGSVAIEVATSSNGSVTVPPAVEGTMEECDYATFSYNGGDTATVSFTSENTTSYAREAIATFTYGLASASVTVQQGINPANKLGYELVTDASTLAVGDEVIIVAKNANKALGVSTSTITSQTSFPGADIAKSGNVIYDAVEAGVQTFTVATGSKANTLALTFTHKNSNYYLYLGSTALKGQASTSSSYTNFSIAVDPTSGVATITNSASTAAIVTYNATSGKFGATKVSSDKADDTTNDIAIYKKQVKK